jgi:hypothetical protein
MCRSGQSYSSFEKTGEFLFTIPGCVSWCPPSHTTQTHGHLYSSVRLKHVTVMFPFYMHVMHVMSCHACSGFMLSGLPKIWRPNLMEPIYFFLQDLTVFVYGRSTLCTPHPVHTAYHLYSSTVPAAPLMISHLNLALLFCSVFLQILLLRFASFLYLFMSFTTLFMLVKQGLLLPDLTLTLTAFLKSVGWIAHKSMGRYAHGRERWVLQR